MNLTQYIDLLLLKHLARRRWWALAVVPVWVLVLFGLSNVSRLRDVYTLMIQLSVLGPVLLSYDVSRNGAIRAMAALPIQTRRLVDTLFVASVVIVPALGWVTLALAWGVRGMLGAEVFSGEALPRMLLVGWAYAGALFCLFVGTLGGGNS